MKRWIALVLAVFMTVMPGTALAQGGNPGWMAGKWGFGGDCTSRDAVPFTLEANGLLRLEGGGQGRWSATANALTFNMEGDSEEFPFVKISNDRFDVGGVPVKRCAPPPPPLTAKWLTGTKWSGHSDCAVVITFASGGRVKVSNGATGTWSLSGGRILLSVGNRPLSLERRSERQLVEVESQSAFVRC